jgi:hypothetical protein
MSQTISDSISTGITLSVPAVITTTGEVVTGGFMPAVVDGAGAGTLTNDGVVAGEFYGVSLANGGTVINQTGGHISGEVAIAMLGEGSVSNSGTISGLLIGVNIAAGIIDNESTGKISGGARLTSGTLINSGNIAAETGSVVYFKDGGSVLNLGSAANLSGGAVAGVTVEGAPGYVKNQGLISGIALQAGGSVTNQGSVSLGTASTAIEISGAAGYIQNSGNALGVALYNGGVVANAAGGIISGYVDGVSLTSGGSVTNSGKIYGVGGPFGQIIPSSEGNAGISISGAGTIYNSGTVALIDGTYFGIETSGTGQGELIITNLGTITGKTGIEIAGSVATTIVDDGTITGVNGVAVEFGSGNDVLVLGPGAVINGLIEGGSGNDVVELDSRTISNLTAYVNIDEFISADANWSLVGSNVLNFGETLDNTTVLTITNTLQVQGVMENKGTVFGQVQLDGSGSYFSSAAAFFNQAHGVITSTLASAISGAAGLYPVTIENAGTITDTAPGAFAISFSGSGADELQLDPGSVIDGIVNGGSADQSVLLLTYNTIQAEISSIGSSYVNFGTVFIAENASWEVNSSTIAVLDNFGTIILDPTTLTVNGLYEGAGVIEIGQGSALILNGAAAGDAAVEFTGTDATLTLGDAPQFDALIAGMDASDTIDLSHVSFDPGGSVSLAAHDVLKITEHGTVTSIQIDPVQNYANAVFHISSNGLNGTDVTETGVPCFLAGTKIATPAGEVAVERLKIGDLVSTGAGTAQPVKWIGRRSYKAPLPDDPDIIPVQIKAGALGPDVPARDLYLSPLHAVMLDGLLVPAGALINDVSIRYRRKLKSITYYHIEMEHHRTVFANGAEAETFIDRTSRQMFDNADEYYRLYPPDTMANHVLCAPRLEFGPELERLRRKVALRAGVLLGHARTDTVIGFLEQADRQIISGWAYAPLSPNMPVNLEIMNRGALLARTVANMPRPDVKLAGFGHGRCGFSITLPAPLPALIRHEISVRPMGSTSCLIGSPAIIDPGIAHDLLRTGSLQTLIDAAVKGLGKASEIELFGSSLEAAGKMIKMQAADGNVPVGPRQDGPLVLMLDENWPAVSLDAGSNAVMSHALALQELGYQVAFCATSGPPRAAASHAGLSALQAAGIECHGHDGKTAEAAIRFTAERGLALVYLHRLATATAYGGLVRHYAPAAKVIYAVADLHHLRLSRQAEVTGRPDLALRAGSVKAAEFWAMQMADCVLTHSAFEAAYLREAAPRMNVHVVPWAITAAPKTAGRNRSNIAFIGGAGHAPNLDAVDHLARDIMPLVWQRDPTIKCYVAGPGWPENLFKKLDLRIVNRGYQPDLTALLNEVKLTVAPLRFGAGIKGKVLQSMAAGTACVMSSIAAEGLPLDDQLRAITGDGAVFAENVLKIYGNKKLNRLTVQAGLDMIETRFSQPEIVSALAVALGLESANARQAAQMLGVQSQAGG